MGTRPAAERWSVANDERGVRTLVERLIRDAPALIVLEATGGYELLAVSALVAAGLPARRSTLTRVPPSAATTR